MITGRVASDGGEATITPNVRGPTGRTSAIAAVVDTGFNGALSLPPDDIDKLELRWLGHVVATLADGSRQMAETYTAEVLWDQRSQRITVTAVAGEPLVGMSLMKNYRLTIDVLPHGTLTLEPLRLTNHN